MARNRWFKAGSALAVAGLLVGFLAVGATSAAHAAEQRFADVVGVQVKARGGDVFDFDVTVSSPYDTPQRYADGFRAKGPDGTVYGVRQLWHDHAGEQPFTRDLHGVKIPASVRSVRIQARDQRHGWGGAEREVPLPGR